MHKNEHEAGVVPRSSETTDDQRPGLDTDELKEQDDYLEEALEETFPGSDPISPGHIVRKTR